MTRSRSVAAVALALALLVAAAVYVVDHRDTTSGGNAVAPRDPVGSSRQVPAAHRETNTTAATTSTTTAPTTPHDPAADFTLTHVTTIAGHISPKSVTATGTGLVFAQNMMYTHTVTVYGPDGKLVKTIPDSVDLARFGIAGHPGISRGAPVEAAVDHAHRNVFVTNYSMYGANFGPEGSDNCSGPAGLSRSYVYRVNLAKLAIDAVAPVGMVPKYVAVTPDDRYVLVTNWCSYDLSVLDHDSLHEVARIHLGAYPRGIAVDPASKVAYVAVMGSYNVARVDLRSFAVGWFRGVGSSPRHLVLSPDGRRLFVTLNGDSRVAAVDTATGQVVARVATGNQPRSMTISSDGRALYVVNYASNTVSILRADNLHIVRTFPVPDHPIGITYEPTHHRLWVASYSGEILVYAA